MGKGLNARGRNGKGRNGLGRSGIIPVKLIYATDHYVP